MKCNKCCVDFLENEIDESHDVPCYLFEGNRKGRENQADKFGRHQLCNECHKKYEAHLKLVLRNKAIEFSKKWFKNG